MVEAGVIRVPQKRPLHERLAYLHDSVADLLADLSPDVIVVESAFVHRARAQTALQMGHGRGVILLAAAQYARAPKQDRSTEVAIIELSPAEIKQSVTGSGRAAKEQVQHATASILGLPGPIDQPDASDALAMAIAGTPDECREQLARYEGIIDLPLLYSPSFGLPPERVVDNLDTIIRTFAC